MKPTYLTMLMAFVILSCAPIRSLQNTNSETPFLGSVGKEDKSVISTSFLTIGHPTLNSSISISIQEIPFTKSTFKKYSKSRAELGKKVALQYIDSVIEKPKYVRLEINDKIGLTTQLNSPENKAVRSYLSKDKQHKIVSNISIQLDLNVSKSLQDADELFLISDKNGLLKIQLVKGTHRQLIDFNTASIFEYGVLSFCWGEDVYGNARVETLSDHGDCPNGTERNFQKLSDNKSFLKL